MKNLTKLILVSVLILIGLASTDLAQDTSKKAERQKEEVAKRSEKIHKKVNKLGVGENAMINVLLFDSKTYSGHISDANDKSFTVVEKNGTSTSINYSDVKALEGRNTSKGSKVALYVVIGVGAGLLAVLLIFIHIRYVNG